MAATKANIKNTLKSLESKVNEDDHLFIFVIDHGGSVDMVSESYICLWGNERLYDHELAEMLTPFSEKYANINVVLGQCYAGGFIDDLTKVGCVVAAACSGSESSWACPDIPYDEFVYHWTSAVNHRDHCGRYVYSNVDYDGLVTIDEAFNYAKEKDRRSENPQYVSTPVWVGEDLAFNHLAPAVNLYVKDDPDDMGREPNCTSKELWKSPSIWVRNKADGLMEHENPYYSEDHQAATVYVRVHNRGKRSPEKGEWYLHTYWAKAATGFVPETWMGDETDTNGEVTGGPVNVAKVLYNIESGGYADFPMTWGLSTDYFDTSSEDGSNRHHFCLLAKIMDTHKEPWKTGDFSYNLWKSNKEAQKNVSIVTPEQVSGGTHVFVRNIGDSIVGYSLEVRPVSPEDEEIFSQADVLMDMSQPVYKAWERGGMKSNEVSAVPALSPTTVKFLGKTSNLKSIALQKQEFDKVSLKFNFKKASQDSRSYTVDLIQKDEDGNIIGGETFVVKSPCASTDMHPITSTPMGDGTYRLDVEADETETVRWETNDGTVIGKGNSVEVTALKGGEKTYNAYILSNNGELATESITLDSETGIAGVSLDGAKTRLNVDLKGDMNGLSSLVVSSVLQGETVLSRNVNVSDKSVELDVSSLKEGIYVVSLVSDGEVMDSVKFSK